MNSQVRPISVEKIKEKVVKTVFTYYFQNMSISHDGEAVALSITLPEITVTAKHPADGIAADDDSEGRLAGLEIPGAPRRFGGKETLRRVERKGIGA